MAVKIIVGDVPRLPDGHARSTKRLRDRGDDLRAAGQPRVFPLSGVHPDILSVDPQSGEHIQVNYVHQDSNTQFLEGLLQSMGPRRAARHDQCIGRDALGNVGAPHQ